MSIASFIIWIKILFWKLGINHISTTRLIMLSELIKTIGKIVMVSDLTPHNSHKPSLYSYEPYELYEPLQGLKAKRFRTKEKARFYLKQFGLSDNIILD